jgi:Pilus formation protein N terminal region
MPNKRSSFCARAQALATASLAAVCVSSSLLALPAAAQDLIVNYDQSQLLRLSRPVAEIIIGNPSIAEISVHSANTLILTGKTFGLTNVIMLDADRNIIQEHRVMVKRDEARAVHLIKGSKRETYNCSPQCNPSLVIGDDPAYFNATAGIFEKKTKMTEQAAENNSGPSQ